jgi:hypothetical protein
MGKEQTRCPAVRCAGRLANALIWQRLRRDYRDVISAPAYRFVVRRPQLFSKQAWRFYHRDQPAADRTAR